MKPKATVKKTPTKPLKVEVKENQKENKLDKFVALDKLIIKKKAKVQEIRDSLACEIHHLELAEAERKELGHEIKTMIEVAVK